jgi:phosphatidylglycerol:prolipoprotein diacylglycerol transferase
VNSASAAAPLPVPSLDRFGRADYFARMLPAAAVAAANAAFTGTAVAATFPRATPEPVPGYWVHNLDPFLIRFSENFGLRWYGLAYLVSFFIGSWLLGVYSRRGKSPLTSAQNSTLLFALILGVIFGARLGEFLLYQREVLAHDPLAVFRVWEGGMSSHGGMVGVWLALGIFAWCQKMNYWRLLDIVVTLAPPGFLLGRIANFINGELPGRETDVPWAVVFRAPYSSGGAQWYLLPRHPSTLYAAALEGALMVAFTQWRFWRFKLPPGQLVGETMVAYGAVRVADEFFREPDASDVLPAWLTDVLSPGQFYSVLLALAGAGVIVWARTRKVPPPAVSPAAEPAASPAVE